MENKPNGPIEKDEKLIFNNINLSKCKWFFNTFPHNKRQEIFEIIYDFLFKDDKNPKDQPFSPDAIKDYIRAKDARFNNKNKEEIIQTFKIKKQEINKKLKEYNLKLTLKDMYFLNLEDIKGENSLEISCLRNIRFGNQYEWVSSPEYLLYFQYSILEYKRPSLVQCIKDNKEEKVDSINSVTKANNLLLNNENLIYIKDSNIQNIDFNKIYEDGNQKFSFLEDNIFEYLEYEKKDPKQIEESYLIYNNNYRQILNFSFEIHFDNLIYSFQNGNYFFELNLINCLNSYYTEESKFFYINFKKIKKIFNKKDLFKKYLAFWITKLFLDNKKIDSENKDDKIKDSKSKYIDFANDVIKSVFKNRENYLEIILDKISEEFPKNRILVILNNIEPSGLKLFEQKQYHNLNILFIFNIQNNFEVFQNCYYEEKRLKKFFLENKDEISYKDPIKKNNDMNFYSRFQTKDEYEILKKKLINEIFKDYKKTKDKLLNLALILNISEFINKNITQTDNSILKLKNDLRISSNISILKPFLPLINLCVSVDESHTIFKINDIKFKEIFFYEHLKNLYIALMMNYLNANSNELFLDDIKGPLLEKDIILNILTGQIKNDKYNNYINFKEVKVQSIYCLSLNKKREYEDNKNKNIVITQESKTAELYDFAFKIKNHMKLVQISIFKDYIDLEKLKKEAIILDLINFNLNKEPLNIGNIDSYSFAIITSINVFNDYKKTEEENKKTHTFFKMVEHCIKNDYEFYIYNYFENNFYIYNKSCDKIEKFDNFFGEVKKIDLFDEGLDLYKFINSSQKKYSLRATKRNFLYPIENYYQADSDKKIRIINLAKYEFNSSMLEMFTGINNIGLAFWDYDTNFKFNNLKINLNEQTEYFQGNKIVKNKPEIFDNPNNKEGIHSLVFLLSEEEEKIDKNLKKFLQKKRKENELYSGDFLELKNNPKKNQKRKKNNKEEKEKEFD